MRKTRNDSNDFEARFVWKNDGDQVFVIFTVSPESKPDKDKNIMCTVKSFVEYRSLNGIKIKVQSELPSLIRSQVESLLGNSVLIQDGVRLGGLKYIEHPPSIHT
ncbi:MAG: hypothetical protein CME32_18110 [Gimesia sp.]|nr:hypothetical protein [Gimesia sp.]